MIVKIGDKSLALFSGRVPIARARQGKGAEFTQAGHTLRQMSLFPFRKGMQKKDLSSCSDPQGNLVFLSKGPPYHFRARSHGGAFEANVIA